MHVGTSHRYMHKIFCHLERVDLRKEFISAMGLNTAHNHSIYVTSLQVMICEIIA